MATSSITDTSAKHTRVPMGAPLMPTEGICTRTKFTASLVALPMAINQIGRAARPLAWRMALHSSIMHTKAEAMPSTSRQWLATSWLVSG